MKQNIPLLIVKILVWGGILFAFLAPAFLSSEETPENQPTSQQSILKNPENFANS